MNKGKEKPEASVPAAKERKKEDLMYLGPTIMGAVKRGTVYKDGHLPKKAQECIKELPMMERLFIEMDKMPEAVREIGKQQSALRMIYDQIASHFSTQKSTGRI